MDTEIPIPSDKVYKLWEACITAARFWDDKYQIDKKEQLQIKALNYLTLANELIEIIGKFDKPIKDAGKNSPDPTLIKNGYNKGFNKTGPGYGKGIN